MRFDLIKIGRIAMTLSVLLAIAVAVCAVFYVTHTVGASYQAALRSYNEAVSMASLTGDDVSFYKDAALRTQTVTYILSCCFIVMLPSAVIRFSFKPIRKFISKHWSEFK